MQEINTCLSIVTSADLEVKWKNWPYLHCCQSICISRHKRKISLVWLIYWLHEKTAFMCVSTQRPRQLVQWSVFCHSRSCINTDWKSSKDLFRNMCFGLCGFSPQFVSENGEKAGAHFIFMYCKPKILLEMCCFKRIGKVKTAQFACMKKPKPSLVSTDLAN